MDDVDSARIALSQKLTVLADKFTIEAGHWARGEQQAACIATARRLDQLARHALGSADPDHVAGELDAADLLYRQVTGTRMFFTAYLPTNGAER